MPGPLVVAVVSSACGQRCHALTSPGRYRALTAFLLLTPSTPMLFQGQEFAASSPFLFFADHGKELAKQVRSGRAKFLAQFPSIAIPDIQAGLPDPGFTHQNKCSARPVFRRGEEQVDASALLLTAQEHVTDDTTSSRGCISRKPVRNSRQWMLSELSATEVLDSCGEP